MAERAHPARWLAVGGIAGPAVFVADWAALGAAKAGYSPVADAISRLAATGATTRGAMTAGFVVYGAGLVTHAWALRSALPGRAWTWVAATGVTTFGVAAFPLGTPVSGNVHAAFAAAGYATLAAAPGPGWPPGCGGRVGRSGGGHRTGAPRQRRRTGRRPRALAAGRAHHRRCVGDGRRRRAAAPPPLIPRVPLSSPAGRSARGRTPRWPPPPALRCRGRSGGTAPGRSR
jgi:hypothetical protein